MKSRLIAAWVLATAVAVTLAYQAVGLVQTQVTEQAPVLAAVEETPSTIKAGDLPSVPPTVTVPEDVEDRIDAPPTSQSGDTVGETTGDSTSIPATTMPTPSTSSTVPAGSPTTSTPTTVPDQQADFIILSDGGTVTVTCSGDVIGFQSSLASPGFQTDIRSEGPQQVDVRFKDVDKDHSFEIKATCDDGEVRPEVHEDD